MDRFQQQTTAIFTRRWIENAVDRGDFAEAMRMSEQLDALTLQLLRGTQEAPLTATGGKV